MVWMAVESQEAKSIFQTDLISKAGLKKIPNLCQNNKKIFNLRSICQKEVSTGAKIHRFY
jgi:hypothetical protein